MPWVTQQGENGGVSFNDGTDPVSYSIPQPASGTIKLRAERFGKMIYIVLQLNRARMTVSRNGSGSFAAIPLINFANGVNVFTAAKQRYDAFAESAGLSTSGNAAFVMGVGTVAVATQANGALTGTSVNVGSSTATLTNSGGTTTGRQTNLPNLLVDGVSAATTLYLNFSGTTASVIANGTIDVTGEIVVAIDHLGN